MNGGECLKEIRKQMFSLHGFCQVMLDIVSSAANDRPECQSDKQLIFDFISAVSGLEQYLLLDPFDAQQVQDYCKKYTNIKLPGEGDGGKFFSQVLELVENEKYT